MAARGQPGIGQPAADRLLCDNLWPLGPRTWLPPTLTCHIQYSVSHLPSIFLWLYLFPQPIKSRRPGPPPANLPGAPLWGGGRTSCTITVTGRARDDVSAGIIGPAVADPLGVTHRSVNEQRTRGPYQRYQCRFNKPCLRGPDAARVAIPGCRENVLWTWRRSGWLCYGLPHGGSHMTAHLNLYRGLSSRQNLTNGH